MLDILTLANSRSCWGEAGVAKRSVAVNIGKIGPSGASANCCDLSLISGTLCADKILFFSHYVRRNSA